MPMIEGMDIKGIASTMINAVNSGEQSLKAQAQLKLAKKTLDLQKEQMATLLSQMQGVGMNIDVKV